MKTPKTDAEMVAFLAVVRLSCDREYHHMTFAQIYEDLLAIHRESKEVSTCR